MTARKPSVAPPFCADEIVVKITRAASDRAIGRVSWRPPRYLAKPATRLGHDALDRAFDEIGLLSVRRLFRARWASHKTSGPPAEERDEYGLYRTYLLRIGSGRDVRKALALLEAHPDIERASLNHYSTSEAVWPNDPEFPAQWSFIRIKLPEAWEMEQGDPNVKVAVIDTGVDLDHADLAANLLPGFDFVDPGTPPAGYAYEGDYWARDNVPDDDVGHGTLIAGIIAAVANNFMGYAGVAWNCRIIPVRARARLVNISTGVPVGYGTDADSAAAIKWAGDEGADVINMSFSGASDSFFIQDAVNDAFDQGAVLIAAMGNQASNVPRYPAAYPNVIAVGASDQTDGRLAVSNTGPHIDVVAPGLNICGPSLDGGYACMDGTSPAAAHVSGLAALIKSRAPALTNAEIANLIRTTARPLGSPTPNDEFGYGLIDAEQAISACPLQRQPVFDLFSRFPWLAVWGSGNYLCQKYPWLCKWPPHEPELPFESIPFRDLPKYFEAMEGDLRRALDDVGKTRDALSAQIRKTRVD